MHPVTGANITTTDIALIPASCTEIGGRRYSSLFPFNPEPFTMTIHIEAEGYDSFDHTFEVSIDPVAVRKTISIPKITNTAITTTTTTTKVTTNVPQTSQPSFYPFTGTDLAMVLLVGMGMRKRR